MPASSGGPGTYASAPLSFGATTAPSGLPPGVPPVEPPLPVVPPVPGAPPPPVVTIPPEPGLPPVDGSSSGAASGCLRGEPLEQPSRRLTAKATNRFIKAFLSQRSGAGAAPQCRDTESARRPFCCPGRERAKIRFLRQRLVGSAIPSDALWSDPPDAGTHKVLWREALIQRNTASPG